MVVETGVIVAGTGVAGSAVARRLAATHPGSAPYVLLDKADGEMLLDVVLSEAGDEVAGALVLRAGSVAPIRAPAVVLATGGVDGLFPGGDWRLSGDGLAIAHRAGVDLAKPHVVFGDGRQELRSGIPCGPDGATRLPGLFVAGSLGSDRPDVARVADAAVVRSRRGCEAMGPYRQQPDIDSPLPEGFVDVKFERLQGLMAAALDGTMDHSRALSELHRLKGEADEYARARVDVRLFSLRNACEVALLLLRG